MKLQSLRMTGFRGISKLKLEFPEQVNVLVGVNGAGKSAVLDCAAIMLSRLIRRIRSSTGTGRSFSIEDINNDLRETANEIEMSFQGKTVRWRLMRARRGKSGQRISGGYELTAHVRMLRSRLEEDEHTDLPLAVYYPVNRAVLDIPLRIRKRHQFDRLAAYDQALSGEWSSFRVFFEWFREREDLENERRLGNPRFRDPLLRAVRTATERFLPDFRGLRVRRSPLRMVIEKRRKTLIVSQLSDGEKCTLAMVGDLARRMAIANPHMPEPLHSEAVVLIDEIDLHLHPGWQRHIIPALRETFPNCQFLLSTHSPQILSHLDRNSVWLLERRRLGVRARRPEDAYGQEVGRILEDLMGVPARPQEVQNQLEDLFRAIDEGQMDTAKGLLSGIRDRIGTDPALVKADVLILRREMLGK